MDKSLNKIIIISLLGFLSLSSISSAQSVINKKVNSDNKVEVSFPVDKDDFLLFYGVTKNDDTNTKINDLRKDFITKFAALKSDYKASLNEVVDDTTLIPPTEEIKKDLKSPIKSPTVAVKQISTTKKSDTSTNKDQISIDPVVNIIDSQSIIHTENSSWFQKVKSFFGW